MKRRSIMAAMMALITAGGLLTGCGANGAKENPGAGQNSVQGESHAKTELTFFHYLEQYQDQFDKLAEMYAEANPDVELKIECIGSDYDKILQTRVASGEVPDIFISGPYMKNQNYASVSYDLSNEEFVKEVEIGPEFKASNGELTAIPFVTQAWGVLYNQEVFEKLGITEAPETLEELDVVCRKIQDAGIIPFAMGYKSDYVKKQLFGFTFGVDENYKQNIEQLANKEKELKDFEFIYKIFDGAELVGKYLQPNPFNDDFATAGAKLGTGEAAMMICGDQIVQNARKANPDSTIGLMPYPLSNDPADAKIYTCASAGLHVSRDSANRDAALEFINWMVTSQEVKDWLSNDMEILSAIKGVTPTGSQVMMDAQKWTSEGKASAWASNLFPQGVETELIAAMDKFLLGDISKEEAIDEMNTAWTEFEN